MTAITPHLPANKPTGAGVRMIAAAAVIGLLYYGQVFFITLTVAGIISFLLEPFVEALMKVKLPRGLASFVVCSVALLLVYLSGLAVFTQASGLVQDLPQYSQRLGELIENFSKRMEDTEASVSRLLPRRLREKPQVDTPQQPTETARQRKRRVPDPPPTPPAVQDVRIQTEPTPLWSYVYDYVSRFYNVLLMASFVPFLVYFMLSWRDHIHRSFMQLFHGADRQVATKTWQGMANVARAYVVGNFVLGVLLSVVSILFFALMRLPYPLLIGPLSGFLSLVPYVGLPMAMVPPLFAALANHDTLTPYLIIGTTVAFLHLLALNLLYPKLVGGRVHLNPLVVTIALMFWGTLWGAVGLVLAIPLTAGIKAICDNVNDLQPYGKLLGD